MLIRKFGATWCPPCKRLDPILEQIDTEYENVTVEHVDVDENPELARQYSVTGIPAMFIYNDEGEQVNHLVGAVPRQKILEALGV